MCNVRLKRLKHTFIACKTCNIGLTSKKCVLTVFPMDSLSCNDHLGPLRPFATPRTLDHRWTGIGPHALCMPSKERDASTSGKRTHGQCFVFVDESMKPYPRQDLVQEAWITIPLWVGKNPSLSLMMWKTESTFCQARFVLGTCYTHSQSMLWTFIRSLMDGYIITRYRRSQDMLRTFANKRVTDVFNTRFGYFSHMW